MKAPQTYGKSERLKSRKRIELLFKEGKRISIAPLMFIYRIHIPSAIHNPESGIHNPQSQIRNPESSILHPESGIHNPQSGIRNAQSPIPLLQAGVGVRSKQFRHAVDRNRIKRLLRECWRTQHNELRDRVASGARSLDVFILYTGTELPTHGGLHQKTAEGIGKILERYEGNGQP